MLNIGERIGHVIVLEEDAPHISPSGTKHRRYICQCECGNRKSFIEWNLKKAGDHANCGGITVCDEWRDYVTFESWALNNGYIAGLSIDRIDVNGNYCPQNCRWATDYTQMNNRRNTYYLEHNGTQLPLSEWSVRTGLSRETIRQRIIAGWSVEKALTTPLDTSKSTIAKKSQTKDGVESATRI